MSSAASRRTTVDTDPNGPYITLVCAPSELMPLVDLTHIMQRRWDYENDPVGAQQQASYAMTLIRLITDRELGLAALIPDDLLDEQ